MGPLSTSGMGGGMAAMLMGYNYKIGMMGDLKTEPITNAYTWLLVHAWASGMMEDLASHVQ